MKFHHQRWAATALFVVMSSVSTFTHAAPVSGQGTWETTLQGRDLDGNLSTAEAYYDTALNITWLADANVAGSMNWANASAWAAGLSINNITGWRLPTMTDTGTLGCDFAYSGTDCGYNVDTSTSEMAYLFYTTLGNKAYYDTSLNGPQPGWGLTNTGLFSNVQPNGYWSATEFALTTYDAWHFNTNDGLQSPAFKTDSLYAWAVHSGNVGASMVPVPAAIWLLGSGLVGLFGFVRHRARPT